VFWIHTTTDKWRFSLPFRCDTQDKGGNLTGRCFLKCVRWIWPIVGSFLFGAVTYYCNKCFQILLKHMSRVHHQLELSHLIQPVHIQLFKNSFREIRGLEFAHEYMSRRIFLIDFGFWEFTFYCSWDLGGLEGDSSRRHPFWFSRICGLRFFRFQNWEYWTLRRREIKTKTSLCPIIVSRSFTP
jgi:hypothetical protein